MPSPITWQAVEELPQYQDGTADDKIKLIESWWNDIALPSYQRGGFTPDQVGDERKRFDAKVYPSNTQYQIDRFQEGVAGVVNTAPRLLQKNEFGLDVDKAVGFEALPPPGDNARTLGGFTEFAGASTAALPFTIMGGVGLKLGPALVTEIASNFMGGVGSELLGDITDDRRTGEFWGSLAGVSSLVVGGLLFKGGAKAHKTWKNRRSLWDAASEKRIGQLLTHPRDDYIKNIEAARWITDQINADQGLKVNFNLAQMSDSPGIKTLIDVYERANPEALNTATFRYDENKKAIAIAKERLFPGSEITTEQALRISNQDSLKTLSAGLDDVEQQQGGLAVLYGRKKNVTPEAVGKALRKRKIVRQEIIRNRFDIEWKGLYSKAEQDGVTLDVSDIADWLDELNKQDPTFFEKQDFSAALKRAHSKWVRKGPEDAPAGETILPMSMQGLLQEGIEDAPVEASFAEFHSLWKLINRERHAVEAKGGTPFAVFEELRTRMGDTLDKLQASETDVGIGLRDLNTRYDRDFRQIFKRGSGGKMTAKGRMGYLSKDEDILNTIFFREDKTAALDDFLKIYGDDQEAWKILENGVMDKFAKEAIDNQTKLVTPKSVNNFLAKYDLLMDRLPGLKEKIIDAGARSDALAKRAGTIKAEQTLLSKEKLEGILDNKDIDGLMDFLVTSPRHLKDAAGRATRNGAGEDFASILAQKITTLPNRFEYLTTNAVILKPIFNRIRKGHWENIQTIVDALEFLDSAKPASMGRVSAQEDIGTKKVGVSLDSLFSRIRAAQEGRSSMPQAWAHIGGKWLTKFGRDQLWSATEKALHDPDLAVALAKASREGPLVTESPVLERSLRFHMTNAGIRSLSQLTGRPSVSIAKEEEEDRRRVLPSIEATVP